MQARKMLAATAITAGFACLAAGNLKESYELRRENASLRSELAKMKAAVASEALASSVEGRILGSVETPLAGKCSPDEVEMDMLIEKPVPGLEVLEIPMCLDSCGMSRISAGRLLLLRAGRLAGISGDERTGKLVEGLSDSCDEEPELPSVGFTPSQGPISL
jgi:hypothetical protein